MLLAGIMQRADAERHDVATCVPTSQVFVAILTKAYPRLAFPMRELQLAMQSARLHGNKVIFIPVWLSVSRQPAADLWGTWEQAWADWELAKPAFISAATYRQNLEILWDNVGVTRECSSTQMLLQAERSRMLFDALNLIQQCGLQQACSEVSSNTSST